MHLKLIVLAAFFVFGMSVSPYRKYADVFRFSEDRKEVIDPSKPIMLGKTEFYWLGHYAPTFGLSVICTVESSSSDWIFGHVFYSNGTAIRGLQFGCPHRATCHGLVCEDHDAMFRVKLVSTVMIVSLLIAFIVAVYYPRRIYFFVAVPRTKPKEPEDEDVEDEEKPEYPIKDGYLSDESIY